ncbi:hypothetical protein [Jeotgalibacillus aurantiacus]|uniref:hypothetical protein n=1 Tax=Jeotgalibacillus aurantiacus TaxID=2763266 RepID=UPI001D0A1830|nr:hypothetical protein [Jeotgalibacillus aurantiacus]
MFKQMMALIRFFLIDMRFSILLFWSIYMISLIPVSVLSAAADGNVYISSTIAILIFCGISGFILLKETFSYTIRLGVTRLEYAISGVIFAAVLAFIMSSTGIIINMIFSALMEWVGWSHVQLINISDMIGTQSTMLAEFGLLMLFSFITLIASFFLSTVFHRFGLVGGLSVVALLFITILIESLRTEVIDWFVKDMELGMMPIHITLNYLSLSILAASFLTLSMLVLWKASIHPGAAR